MRVVGYVRVSTEGQAKSGLGIEAQIEKIRSYCKLYDLDLVDIVVDEGYFFLVRSMIALWVR